VDSGGGGEGTVVFGDVLERENVQTRSDFVRREVWLGRAWCILGRYQGSGIWMDEAHVSATGRHQPRLHLGPLAT
jgi:hypothetical protein